MSAITPTILSDGEAMDPAYSLLSVDVSKEVNRISQAQLTLLDGTPAAGDFPISNTAFFEPGKEIEIKLRYEGEDDVTVFKGKVVRQGIQAGLRGSVLTVEVKDAALKLTHGRQSIVFRDVTDGDVFGQLIEDAGLTKGDVATTDPQHAELVQFYCSNWDFLLSRAEVLGLLVSVDDGTVSVVEADLSGEAAHSFEYGAGDIFDFEMELDAAHQYAAVETVAWDLEQQQLSETSTAEDISLSQGNLDGASVAEGLGFETTVLSDPVPLAPEELQSWADARLARARLALIRGRLSVRGNAGIKPLDVIELVGMGERFSGNTLVTGVRHRVDDRGWRTDLQFGLSPDWFSRRPDIQDVPAAGLLPPVSGLQIGVVDAYEEDPDEQLRVRVALPALGAEDAFVWARLATPDAGAGRGDFFRPETGDEVVVGFFNEDPRQAVILGAMYGTTNTAPDDFAELSEDNLNKGIVTKKGTKIWFEDGDKAKLTIETEAGNKILWDDDGEAIQIVDQHDNAIAMNGDGIEIISSGDFKVEASGNVEITGQEVDIK